ncbi:hypothetical protein YPPY25_4563, partial [Yersinia pestis PY-25]
MRAIA